MSNAKFVAVGIAILLWFAIVPWWTCAQWRECREAGMTKFYCVQHVLR